MLSALAPVFIDRLRPVGLRAYAPGGGLDWDDIVSGDDPFSDGQRQHDHCITEKGYGRQPKMKKILMVWNLSAGLVKNWVETKNFGLKFDEFSACRTC